MSDTKEYAPTEAGRREAREHLAIVEDRHQKHPACALCGQHALVLDRFGLCSKTSAPHEEWRNDARAEAKAARR